MSEFENILAPLIDEVKFIEESLTPNRKEVIEDEFFEYGKFEREFESFRLHNLRNGGVKIKKIDFICHLEKELSKIEKFLLLKETDKIIKSDLLHKEIEHCRAKIELHKARLKKVLTPENIKANSLEWSRSDKELQRLHTELLAFGAIKVNFEVFKDIFKNPIDKTHFPILWLKGLQDLVYLFEQLTKLSLIRKRFVLSILDAYNVFITSDRDTPLKRNNYDKAQTKYRNIHNYHKPRNAAIIDQIVNGCITKVNKIR